ncbi:MAG: hypothetical protein BECKG1743D_GA0114223_104255 [Candidatus Kentron sp. G]|nr:MAG: hypothetical protein BECKG1743F_GA0114225_104425 [Candidatus Kentron sp. G]VFN01169.1 MAG: hypothetical protein BECKG1743E_GA0114224_103865 [Candidatus Kentron sp. G]VFN03049.1 MAG: hypothetical protein BECKG1743D_GA0114223_104255 [Candidatus Kentron sp. G]
MKTEAEIRKQGMRALINALGLVEAERFLAAVSRDGFDYTEWRRQGLPRMDVDELANAANRLTQERDSRAQ